MNSRLLDFGRQHRYKLAAGGALAAIVLAVAVSTDNLPGFGSGTDNPEFADSANSSGANAPRTLGGVASDAVEAGSAALASLFDRSPGARQGGVALKAKARRFAAASPGARRPGRRPAAAAPAPAAATPPDVATAVPPSIFLPEALPGVGEAIPPIALGPDTPVNGGGGFYNPGFGGGGGGIFIPGPGGNPGGPIVDVPNPPPGPPPTAAVPEPGTWLMLILGFGAVGAGLRRRRVRVAYS